VNFKRLDELSTQHGPLAIKRKGKIRELKNLSSLADSQIEREMLTTLETGSTKNKRLLLGQSIDVDG
jgi:hypothetical protein